MKKLLMVTLLLLLASVFVSCNSYDVEGKPEVASNPAKKVFAYYPWGDNSSQQEVPDNQTGNDDETTPDEEVADNEVPDEVVDETQEPDDTVVDEDPDTAIPDDDTTIVFKAEGETADDTDATDGNEPPADNTTDSTEDLTEIFEIYNRGVTGELKIAEINILDPDGNAIEEIDNNTYKQLFKMQIQEINNGIASTENDAWGPKLLTFNNLEADDANRIASLCPLDPNKNGECKESFSTTKYNANFKILLTYSKSAAETLKDNPPANLKLAGDFAIEICTNDTGKDKSSTCPNGTSSYKIQITRQPNKPPKPIIHVTFDYTTGGPMSYRNIKDEVSMNLTDTCVSDPEKPSECLANWSDRYYIKYKWEMKQSPTPLREESTLELPDYSEGKAGQWLPDVGGSNNPKRAEFTGLMVTPRRYPEENPDYNESTCETECGSEPANIDDKFYFMDLSNFLLCRQKYCEKTKTRYYKVNIQAETVDKETDLVSDTAEVTVVPKIIPQARVVAQLTWVEGFKTKTEAGSDKEGTKVDLDIHLIKRSSLEAGTWNYTPTDGVMCTNQQYEGMDYSPTDDLDSDGKPDYEEFYRHDDCYFADQGLEIINNQTITETIAWNATFDLDNTWGGNNYENPETIGLGPIEDKDGDGKPDKQIMNDQYLVVVGYSYCTPKDFADSTWDTCCDPSDTENCNGDGSAYEVHARVDILIDGFEAARDERTQNGNVIRPADNFSETSKLFTIKPDEWKVIAAIKWDNSLPGPESNPSYEGDAIVSDVAMTDEDIEIDASNYQTCKFDVTLCELVPIWDEQSYYDFVDQKQNPADETSPTIGECY